ANDVPAGGAPACWAIVAGPAAPSALVRSLDLPLAAAGDEGFLVRRATLDGRTVTVVAANRDVGVLYGVFALLRELETGTPLAGIELASAPRLQHRVLNHWDNLDGTVERGYSGRSIWDWWRLPEHRDPRYRDYARANASI